MVLSALSDDLYVKISILWFLLTPETDESRGNWGCNIILYHDNNEHHDMTRSNRTTVLPFSLGVSAVLDQPSLSNAVQFSLHPGLFVGTRMTKVVTSEVNSQASKAQYSRPCLSVSFITVYTPYWYERCVYKLIPHT